MSEKDKATKPSSSVAKRVGQEDKRPVEELATTNLDLHLSTVNDHPRCGRHTILGYDGKVHTYVGGVEEVK